MSKASVNLTLNEARVVQAKTYTSNLSATMEDLLATYVDQQQPTRLTRQDKAVKGIDFYGNRSSRLSLRQVEARTDAFHASPVLAQIAFANSTGRADLYDSGRSI